MKRLSAALALIAIAACTPIVESKPMPLTARQIEEIKTDVNANLFDPYTSHYRNIRSVAVTYEDGRVEQRVCGEVNAKNRLGGYVGYTPFGGEIVQGRFIRRAYFLPC